MGRERCGSGSSVPSLAANMSPFSIVAMRSLVGRSCVCVMHSNNTTSWDLGMKVVPYLYMKIVH